MQNSIQTSFTDWEDGLEHYGIPGMKWGVRRFQTRDGTLTPAGQKRYGSLGRGSSARAMTKHLNKLDAGYANVEARRKSYAATASRKAFKANKALAKGNQKKAEKLMQKAEKAGRKAGEANRTKPRIENLQWRIIAKAAQKGYTTNSEAVKRFGSDGKTRVAKILGGPLGNWVYSSYKKGRNTASVDGQSFAVSRRGDRSTNVVNYNLMKNENVRRIMQEERDKERAKRFTGSKR